MYNPFSPAYGVTPSAIFGREQILRRFDAAMLTQGSPDRAIYVTGMHASGKTTLLKLLAKRTRFRGRFVISLGPDYTVERMLSALLERDVAEPTVSPEMAMSALGTGGAWNGSSSFYEAHYGREHLHPMLIEACKLANHGVLVAIDDLHEMDVDDVSAIANAVQMASRKGYDIMLAVASLPSGYDRAIRHDGCSFLRRATLVELGLLTYEEAHRAFVRVFDTIDDLDVSVDALMWMNQRSYGHPYLMQLLGYFAVEELRLRGETAGHVLDIDVLEEIEPIAMTEYERRVLKPMIDELSPLEYAYLKAMNSCLDEDRLAKSGEIAMVLNKSQGQLSRARERLIGSGIIASPERGMLMNCVPYLSAYIMSERAVSDVVSVERSRRV